MEAAFDWKRTFEQLAPQLVLYARQLVQTKADAEDVVQMAFVRWWRRFPEGDSQHIPLLYAAVRTIALDQRRSDQRRTTRESKSEIALESEDAPVFDPLPEQKETASLVEQALQTLPKEQREVVTLHLWGGLTFKEIAAIAGDSINTVAGRYRYALNNLQKKLAPLKDELVTSASAPAINVLPFSNPTEVLS
ncbi:MAG: RNA polymerase sigma factor [Verrucomicrobiaceae bacterium]|nr:RNA polymerase sigma factor [Verrucomicrobiaceae bacterium]